MRVTRRQQVKGHILLVQEWQTSQLEDVRRGNRGGLIMCIGPKWDESEIFYFSFHYSTGKLYVKSDNFISN